MDALSKVAEQLTPIGMTPCPSKVVPSTHVNLVMPLIPRNVLNPPSAEYFRETRAQRFGMSLDELESKEGGEKAWSNAKEPLDNLAKILRETEGPYFLGGKSTYQQKLTVEGKS